MPAVNALGVVAMNTALTVGPLLAGVLVDVGGYRAAYTADALLTLAAVHSLLLLRPVPPGPR